MTISKEPYINKDKKENVKTETSVAECLSVTHVKTGENKSGQNVASDSIVKLSLYEKIQNGFSNMQREVEPFSVYVKRAEKLIVQIEDCPLSKFIMPPEVILFEGLTNEHILSGRELKSNERDGRLKQIGFDLIVKGAVKAVSSLL